jgi:hypothetical protein
MTMTAETERRLSRVANPLVPPLGDKPRLEGLQAQVEDLKYTLSNVLQCLVAHVDRAADGRNRSLIEDARAALRAEAADYLG